MDAQAIEAVDAAASATNTASAIRPKLQSRMWLPQSVTNGAGSHQTAAW